MQFYSHIKYFDLLSVLILYIFQESYTLRPSTKPLSCRCACSDALCTLTVQCLSYMTVQGLTHTGPARMARVSRIVEGRRQVRSYLKVGLAVVGHLHTRTDVFSALSPRRRQQSRRFQISSAQFMIPFRGNTFPIPTNGVFGRRLRKVQIHALNMGNIFKNARSVKVCPPGVLQKQLLDGFYLFKDKLCLLDIHQERLSQVQN